MKPLIFRTFRIVRRQLRGKAVFVYFTNPSTHEEVRSLAEPGDELVCLPRSDEEMPASELAPSRESIGDPDDVLLLKKHEISALYCPFGWATLAMPGVPTIACVVDLIHLDFPSTLTHEEIWLRDTLLQETIRVSDALNCISLHVVDRIIDRFPDYSGEIFYTYNAIHDRLDEVDPSPLAPPCESYFFYPSNFWVHKNHEVLLIAYRNYLSRTEDEPWDLVLTGAESERTETIRNHAETLGISDRVHFLGFVDESCLATLWQKCSALVFPSMHEGFGIPLLEAMHFRKPIVASSACCLPEIGGDACLFVDPAKPLELADALFKIFSEKELRAKLIRNGELRLKDFAIENEMAKLSYILLHTECSSAWNKGIYPDGWIGADALLGLSDYEGRWKLSLSISGRGCPTRVSVKVSGNPFGSYVVPGGAPTEISLWLRDPKEFIQLSVEDPVRLSEEDERLLGARIHSVTMESESDETDTLFKV